MQPSVRTCTASTRKKDKSVAASIDLIVDMRAENSTDSSCLQGSEGRAMGTNAAKQFNSHVSTVSTAVKCRVESNGTESIGHM